MRKKLALAAAMLAFTIATSTLFAVPTADVSEWTSPVWGPTVTGNGDGNGPDGNGVWSHSVNDTHAYSLSVDGQLQTPQEGVNAKGSGFAAEGENFSGSITGAHCPCFVFAWEYGMNVSVAADPVYHLTNGYWANAVGVVQAQLDTTSVGGVETERTIGNGGGAEILDEETSANGDFNQSWMAVMMFNPASLDAFVVMTADVDLAISRSDGAWVSGKVNQDPNQPLEGSIKMYDCTSWPTTFPGTYVLLDERTLGED